MKIFLSTLLFILSVSLSAQNHYTLDFEINVSPDMMPGFKDEGRLIVLVSSQERPAPVYQRPLFMREGGFAVNIKNWDITQTIQFSGIDSLFSADGQSIDFFPEGVYFVQAVYNISGEPRLIAEGNLISEVKKVDLNANQLVELTLGEYFTGRNQAEPEDSEFIKYIELKSEILSAWWGKPMFLKASVLLPGKYNEDTEQTYPLRINIGGYGSRCTRVERLMHNSAFSEWWFSDEAPQIVNLFLDGDGPFGDPYYVDSENNGPYGKALTEELIPYIEKEFRGAGSPELRFVDGCSTGGWVSLALQIFYPGYFNGVWSFSSDPVDFHHMQLVNIYDNDNAFYNPYHYLTPSVRDKNGQPRLSIRDEVAGENLISLQNSYTTSKGQWGAWNAVYSPKGENGLPLPLFDPVTGALDSVAVTHWKKYDLLNYLRNNWEEIGPELERKIWIWMGDADQFYLNNAMHEFDAFLKSVMNPQSFATVSFEPMKGHCEEFDDRYVLEMIREKLIQINQ